MMLELDDDGVFSKVNEEDLIYVDKKELDEFIKKYNHLKEENRRLKSQILNVEEDRDYYKSKSSSLEEGYIRLQDTEIRLINENEQLKNRVDELEDDNMKYTLSTDKLDGYTKRFMPTKCINEFRDCKTNRYYWLDNEDNFTGALELLNLLDCENEELKSENRQLKGRLMEYKEQIKW